MFVSKERLDVKRLFLCSGLRRVVVVVVVVFVVVVDVVLVVVGPAECAERLNNLDFCLEKILK